jgi:hypothetical protein
LLSEREPDHERRQEQKQEERASKKMRLNRGANAPFHFARVSVSKHLLLERRQRCRDIFSCPFRKCPVASSFYASLKSPSVLVRLDHVALVTINANHGIM